MSSRPNFIDLAPRTFDPARNGAPSPSDMPSPRAGDAPPALSPLDAFALQSRLLAQRLEASNSNGQRMSRLPPVTIANALAQNRAAYSGSSGPPDQALGLKRSPSLATPESSTPNMTFSQATHRPVSHYPLILAFDDAESIMTVESLPTIHPVQEEDEEELTRQDTDRGVRSPSPKSTADRDENETWQGLGIQAPNSGSIRSTHSNSNGLAPPRSPHSARSPGTSRSPKFHKDQLSIRSVRMDSGDDSDSLSVHGEQLGERKPSFGSGFSRPRSPFSPIFAPPRSPSISSEYSQSQYPRGSVNFSRPMSRNEGPIYETRPSTEGSIRSNVEAGSYVRPSLDQLSLHESVLDSPRPSAPWLDTGTPNSLTENESSRPGTPSGATSYIYSKYSLPRGRSVARDTKAAQSEPTHKFEWEQAVTGGSNVLPIRTDLALAHTESSLSTSKDGSALFDSKLPTPGFPVMMRTHSVDENLTTDKPFRSHKANPSFPPATASMSSGSSTRTLLPSMTQPLTMDPSTSSGVSPLIGSSRFGQSQSSTSHPMSPDPASLSEALRNLTPEGHLATGIECHENGQLQKSTYHLRLGARGGNPTAMLLYALACRHGWGMRPNQAEGVLWLRKAVDLAGMTVADDATLLPSEVSGKDNHANAVIARRAHKARLALAIYELGVSYMNGWGIAQDKALALRCFEIAGGWGDADALAEAGFCYAKGVGAKKDLKKAADYYRKAADKGVGMAGNSWIYKEKYLPPPEPKDDDRKGRNDKDGSSKKRDKSRTRTIFGAKKKDKDKEKEKE